LIIVVIIIIIIVIVCLSHCYWVTFVGNEIK